MSRQSGLWTPDCSSLMFFFFFLAQPRKLFGNAAHHFGVNTHSNSFGSWRPDNEWNDNERRDT